MYQSFGGNKLYPGINSRVDCVSSDDRGQVAGITDKALLGVFFFLAFGSAAVLPGGKTSELAYLVKPTYGLVYRAKPNSDARVD